MSGWIGIRWVVIGWMSEDYVIGQKGISWAVIGRIWEDYVICYKGIRWVVIGQMWWDCIWLVGMEQGRLWLVKYKNTICD